MSDYVMPEFESKDTEYKEGLPSKHEKYLKTVAAFANGNGGRLVFGVRDSDRVVIGIPNNELSRISDAIANAISDNCEPAIIPDPIFQTLGDKTIIIVDIPKGMQKPYFIKSEGILEGVYVRVGGTTRRAERYLVQELILRGRNRYFDEQPAEDFVVTEDEVDALCNDMYDFAVESNTERGTLNIKRVSKRQLFSWNLLHEGSGKLIPGNGFLLLRGDVKAFPQAQIQCAVFRGKTRGNFVTKRDFSGPIYRQLQDAYNFVLQNIRLGSRVNGIFRRDFYEIPQDSVREMIANAVSHRSYLSPDKIQVALYDDRLEVTSPGMLHDELTVEQMKQGLSKPRNRGIVNAFVYMGIVETWGSGIPKIFAESAEFGLREPELIPSDLTFRINLFRGVQDNDVGNNGTNGINGTNVALNGINGTSTDDIAIELYGNNSVVYNVLARNPRVTIDEIVNDTNVSKRTVNRAIKSLKEKGYIGRVGGTRGRWVILKSGDKGSEGQ